MTYSVDYTKKVLKDLKRLDSQTRKLILSWIEKNLIRCSDPRSYGKELKGRSRDEWCYRVGHYRILANIRDDKILILFLKIGHRHKICD